MFHGGLESVVTERRRWTADEYDGEAIELRELSGWKSQNAPDMHLEEAEDVAETPIQGLSEDVVETPTEAQESPTTATDNVPHHPLVSDHCPLLITDHHPLCIEHAQREEESDEDDLDEDSDTMEAEAMDDEIGQASWDRVVINADGSIDVHLSDGETDDIEDFISLLSESPRPPAKATHLSKPAAYPIDERTRCISNSNIRGRAWERPIVLTPVIRTPKSGTNNSLTEFSKNNTPKSATNNSLTEFSKNTPKSNNLNKDKSKSSLGTPSSTHVAVSFLKMENSCCMQQQCPTRKQLEEENRLRGGATIVAKLPYPKGLDIDHKKHQLAESICGVKTEALIRKVAGELSSSSAPCVTPRQQLLVSGNPSPGGSSGQRLRWTSNNNLVDGSKCNSYHIRVRRRNPPEDASDPLGPNAAPDAEVILSSPKCRCGEHCALCARMPMHSSFNGTAHSPLVNKPPTPTRVQLQPKRTSSIEDAIFRLTKHSGSPTLGAMPDSPARSSCPSSRRIHRTMSTNKITEELRAKLGLPHCNQDCDSQMSPVHRSQFLNALRHQNSLERIMGSQVASTQTIPLGRCYSDSQVNAIARGCLVCCRCMHPCPKEDGAFTCESCIAVQRVKNAFVVEVFADRPAAQSTDPRLHNSTCYGIRIGIGLLPVVVMFMLLIMCTVILLSDTVMTDVCGRYCGDTSAPSGETSPWSAVWGWGWLDPYN